MTTIPSGSSRFRKPRSIRQKARRMRRPSFSVGRIWRRRLLIILAGLVVLVGLHQVWQREYLTRLFRRPQTIEDLIPQCDRLDAAVRLSLDELGAAPIFVLQSQEDLEESGRKWRFRHLTVRVTSQISLLACNLAITRAAEAVGGRVFAGEQSPSGDRLALELGLQDLRTHQLELVTDVNIAPTKGRLALIIDDFGAINNQVADDILKLPIALTVAVIPGHPTSQQIAQRAAAAGHEVFLHLPMQPKEGEVGEENAILTDLNEDEIRQRVRWALAQIPQASGVNNHMGSLATEDEKVMRAVLEEIKKAGKFFVDSRTSPQSVAPQVAQKIGLRCDRSDGFLDDQDDGAEIEKKLGALAEKALGQGTAIGIGHIKANTLETLKRMIPQLERKGVQFVHVSRLLDVRRQQ
jgi:polysaccharide deacetylase 2 family uncharacterized protein YibQ